MLWIIRLLFFKSYKISDKAPLTEKEKQELIDEWQPEPLVPEITEPSTPFKIVTGYVKYWGCDQLCMIVILTVCTVLPC